MGNSITGSVVTIGVSGPNINHDTVRSQTRVWTPALVIDRTEGPRGLMRDGPRIIIIQSQEAEFSPVTNCNRLIDSLPNYKSPE